MENGISGLLRVRQQRRDVTPDILIRKMSNACLEHTSRINKVVNKKFISKQLIRPGDAEEQGNIAPKINRTRSYRRR